jgi:uncharacterized cofD-like protein
MQRTTVPQTLEVRPLRDDFKGQHGPRIVAIGGGTGLPVVLRGLRRALFSGRNGDGSADRDRLTAIVTMSDDGGSSGRLRSAYGILPPGDIRNCLLALADGDPLLANLFDYRFDGSGELGGHSLGNLILAALTHLESDFPRAIERGAALLGARGRVFPSTVEGVHLRAEFVDGRSVDGESRIQGMASTIRRVSLQPSNASALCEAVEAVSKADLVVIGPGSLYTSVIPVLLVEELADAVRRSRARTVLVMNLTTEPGETDHYTAADHVLAIRRHAPDVPLHEILINDAPIAETRVRAYEAAGSELVAPDVELLSALGFQPLLRDIVSSEAQKIRHDASKLAQALLEPVATCQPAAIHAQRRVG